MSNVRTKNRQVSSLLVAALAVLAAACRPPDPDAGAGGADAKTVDLATKSSQGVVSLDLTPHALPGVGIEVALRANTHSGDLSEIDLQEAVALEVEGRTYKPVEAGKLGGHHAVATLRFAVNEVPDRFVITVTGIRDMPLQRFAWP